MCVCVCVCVCVYTYTYIDISTYTHTHTHVYTSTHKDAHAPIHTHYTQASKQAHIRIRSHRYWRRQIDRRHKVETCRAKRGNRNAFVVWKDFIRECKRWDPGRYVRLRNERALHVQSLRCVCGCARAHACVCVCLCMNVMNLCIDVNSYVRMDGWMDGSRARTGTPTRQSLHPGSCTPARQPSPNDGTKSAPRDGLATFCGSGTRSLLCKRASNSQRWSDGF